MKKIWILWGMWPQASIDFYKMLIKKTNKYTNANRNQDYPYIILSNIPVPDLIRWRKNLEKTLNMVNNEARTLEKSWVDFLVMPCNTMHLFQEKILEWINIPFISMIESVVQSISESGIKTIWLLGSSTTMSSDLYTKPLEKIGIKTHIPKIISHEKISQIIQRYIAWELLVSDISFLDKQCGELIQQWAKWIILWCTELPLIMKSLRLKYRLFSSSKILSEDTLKYYYKT